MEIKTKFSIGDKIYSVTSARAGELSGIVCGTVREINLWEEPNESRKGHVWYELYGTSMRDPIRSFNGTFWEACKEVYSEVMCDEENSFATEQEALAEKDRRDNELKEFDLLYAIQRLENTIKELSKERTLLHSENEKAESSIEHYRKKIEDNKNRLKGIAADLEDTETELRGLKSAYMKRINAVKVERTKCDY